MMVQMGDTSIIQRLSEICILTIAPSINQVLVYVQFRQMHQFHNFTPSRPQIQKAHSSGYTRPKSWAHSCPCLIHDALHPTVRSSPVFSSYEAQMDVATDPRRRYRNDLPGTRSPAASQI